MSHNTHKRIRVLLAGGGTGGHIYPGIALAKEFLRRKDKTIECLMLITSKPSDEYILRNEGISYQMLPIKGMNLALSVKAIIELYLFILSFVHSWHIISSFTPDLIIGLGAYASFPVVVIGRIRGITVFIQEQNLRPGKANRLLGRWVNGVFTSFTQSERFFPSQRLRMLGNPIRTLPPQIDKKEYRRKSGLQPDIFTILVCGGTQGAHSINIKAMEAFKIMKGRGFVFQIIHQTGKADYEAVCAFYKKEKIIYLTSPFFNKMMQIYPLADLVVSRSGAGVVSELTATGRPAILIPYPYAKADHQRLNATALVRTGAARMIDEAKLTGEYLAEVILELVHHPECLNAMSEVSLRMGRPKAAQAICDQALLWLEEK